MQRPRLLCWHKVRPPSPPTAACVPSRRQGNEIDVLWVGVGSARGVLGQQQPVRGVDHVCGGLFLSNGRRFVHGVGWMGAACSRAVYPSSCTHMACLARVTAASLDKLARVMLMCAVTIHDAVFSVPYTPDDDFRAFKLINGVLDDAGSSNFETGPWARFDAGRHRWVCFSALWW